MLFNHPQVPCERLARELGKESLKHDENVRLVLSGEPEHDEARILTGRIAPNIPETGIEGDQGTLFDLADVRDLGIVLPAELLLQGGRGVVTGLGENLYAVFGQVLQA
jgi:hypothetical protein